MPFLSCSPSMHSPLNWAVWLIEVELFTNYYFLGGMRGKHGKKPSIRQPTAIPPATAGNPWHRYPDKRLGLVIPTSVLAACRQQPRVTAFGAVAQWSFQNRAHRAKARLASELARLANRLPSTNVPGLNFGNPTRNFRMQAPHCSFYV